MKSLKPALLLLLAVIMIFPAKLFAQKGIKLGVIALPQNTWLLNSDDWNATKNVYNHKVTLGMAGGVKFGWHFGDGIGLRLDALYSLQGQRYTSLNSKNVEVQNNIRLQYLQVPVFLSFNTNTQYAKVMFAFAVGFQGGMLMRARYFNDDETYSLDPVNDPHILYYPTTKKTYSRFTYGPVAEFGIDIKLTYNLMANVRFRGSYQLNDTENKNATVTKIENGIPYRESFWNESRPSTGQITGGILMGLTYTFTEY